MATRSKFKGQVFLSHHEGGPSAHEHGPVHSPHWRNQFGLGEQEAADILHETGQRLTHCTQTHILYRSASALQEIYTEEYLTWGRQLDQLNLCYLTCK